VVQRRRRFTKQIFCGAHAQGIQGRANSSQLVELEDEWKTRSNDWFVGSYRDEKSHSSDECDE
jgi:hypothetical protein